MFSNDSISGDLKTSDFFLTTGRLVLMQECSSLCSLVWGPLTGWAKDLDLVMAKLRRCFTMSYCRRLPPSHSAASFT